ncbi:nineteen complex-related protein 2-domain-containing protein [Aspergillus floccosus]
MSSKLANRRKPRKLSPVMRFRGMILTYADLGPVVKRPPPKSKQKSKLLSFGQGETSMAEDGQQSEVIMPKRRGLGGRALLEKSAMQRSLTPSGSPLPLRAGPDQDRPSYDKDYLKELRDSTPSTPKTFTDDGKEMTDREGSEGTKTVDVAAKFGEVMTVSAPSVIPSEAEIREKKERRARLAKEQKYTSTEEDFISLVDHDMSDAEQGAKDTRLIRDDEDFAEGFDEFVDDGRISLGRKAEREQLRKRRDEMRELIDDAEGLSDSEDSDLEEKAAYEAAQARAAMGNSGRDADRPKTPPKMTSLPRLSNCLDRLRTTLAVMEQSKSQIINRMEELRKEKADIAVREVEIQALIKEAGDNYERLKQEAGAAPDAEAEANANSRGLENIGNSMKLTSDNAGSPRLYRHTDATPTELFFDLFFIASLSVFTATHEIYNVQALMAYIGFLGMIWFTWLQITLYDIRFARDSIFERICKAIQLAAMVGFASAGTRFTPHIQDENLWAFQSLSIFLGGSRVLLGIQYTVSTVLMFFVFANPVEVRPYIWTVWFVLFALEMWIITGISYFTPEIGLQNTHLNVRMGLLTLIIIGEGVIAVTRIVNKTAYFDLTPRGALGPYFQQIWAQLHFPFHVALILLLEGSQILALTLDMTLKLGDLTEMIVFACKEPRPIPERAIDLLRRTISDMEINYSHGAIIQQMTIDEILNDLPFGPLCPDDGLDEYPVTRDRLNSLLGNVTAALFTSMGLIPAEDTNIDEMSSSQLLGMYVGLLGFVYEYFFIVASIVMFLFATFVLLCHRHSSCTALAIAMSARLILGMVLASFVLFIRDFGLAYSFMTSPVILYAFTFILLTVLLVDRLLDHYGARFEARARRKQESEANVMSPNLSVIEL